MEIVPFADEHLDAAAEMLAARHARHRAAEPLLPELTDPHGAIERQWRADGASGVFSASGFLIGAPLTFPGGSWLFAGIAAHAVEGDREQARDIYAAAAQRWVDDGHNRHAVMVPSHDNELVDAWFRLSFGASSVLAMRPTAEEEHVDGGVEIRRGTSDDYPEAARLELEMFNTMQPAPSFSDLVLQSYEETLAEWHEDEQDYELFVAERDGRIVGQFLLYHRPPDLRVPADSIDLAQASVDPEARGTGVGSALTAHVIGWACENGYATMTTDWRMTNLSASRFWPKRGFRPTFLRLYRSLP
jgi:GNAT superfamily N-acetyltransferase